MTQKRDGNGAPSVTPRLRAYIEDEFKKTGYTSRSTGTRSVALSASIKTISLLMGVSEGTIKNALVALRQQGFIVRQEPGMYLVLARESADSSRSQGSTEASSEEKEVEEGDEVDAELRRMSLEAVTAIFRDTIITCGVETASRYIDSHRRWCNLNGITPHI